MSLRPRVGQPSRRALLAAGLLLPLTACTGRAGPPQPPAPPPLDPDVALRAAGLRRERSLLALYDRAIAAEPALAARLAPLRAEHVAHLAALAPAEPTLTAEATPTAATPMSEATLTAEATPTTPALPAGPVTVDRLATAERVAASAALRDLVPASRELAAVLASVSACESTHAAVLE